MNKTLIYCVSTVLVFVCGIIFASYVQHERDRKEIAAQRAACADQQATYDWVMRSDKYSDRDKLNYIYMHRTPELCYFEVDYNHGDQDRAIQKLLNGDYAPQEK